MTVDVQIDDNLSLSSQLNADQLYKLGDIAQQALAYVNKTAYDLSIVITTDEHIATLNETYRGVVGPTDVLSFEAEPMPPEIATEETPYLGDLILAYPYTLARALAANHPPQEEFGLLVVHGILHLCGYTHDNAASQQLMWAKQRELLAHVNITLDVPDYIHTMDDSL